MWNLMICTAHQILFGSSNRENGACSVYGGEERHVQGFLGRGGILRERNHWGDSGVDGRIILKWIIFFS